MISKIVWLTRYRADAEHDYELHFELRGIEDKCTQSGAGFQGFLGRMGPGQLGEVTSFTLWRYVCTGYLLDIAFSQMRYSASLQRDIVLATFVTT